MKRLITIAFIIAATTLFSENPTSQKNDPKEKSKEIEKKKKNIDLSDGKIHQDGRFLIGITDHGTENKDEKVTKKIVHLKKYDLNDGKIHQDGRFLIGITD